MKNLTKIFALTAIAAAAALSTAALFLTGCEVDNNSGGNTATESASVDLPNGTWLYWQDTSYANVLKLDNGAFENGIREDGVYFRFAKGTYTASGSEMTITITDITGFLVGKALDIDDWKEWYSIDELVQAAPELGNILADNMTAQCTYSLDGNELTFTSDGISTTFTRE